MAENLVRVKRRINSISSTRKITNAMKLVSSAKLVKKRNLFFNVVEYSSSLRQIINNLTVGLSEKDYEKYELMQKHEVNKTLYIVITSSLGLCGSYNFNLLKYANQLIKDDDEVLLIGTRGLRKIDENVELDTEYIDLANRFNFSKVQLVRKYIIEKYLSGNYQSIKVIYTHYKNALTFVPEVFEVLPFVSQEVEAGLEYPPIFCPKKEEVFDLLIPKYLDSVLFEKISEALFSEEASRRNAMESATDNADEIIKELEIVYNKARQANITSEITEIVAGNIGR